MKFDQWFWPFQKAGMWTVRRFPEVYCGKQGKKTEEKLKLLETTHHKMTLEEYYGKKFSRLYLLLFVGGLVLGVMAVGFPGKVVWMDMPMVFRPDYGQGALETELEAVIENQEPVSVPITIGERKYTRDEIQDIFLRITDSLEEEILGENASLEEVRSDLKLPSGFMNGLIRADWEVDPPDYMDDSGHIYAEVPSEGVTAVLRVTFRYEKEEWMQEFPARFLPPVRTEREQTLESLREMVAQAEKENPREEAVHLPEKLKDSAVRWGVRTTSPLGVGILLLMVGAWYLYGKDDRELAKEERRRKRQMIMDYPMILYKMSMLLGAGMTIRGAFTRIAFHYRQQTGREVRYAYEEMLRACYEMEKGVGEGAAYEAFGQRCQDLRYLKFGTLLSQNLKKGSRGLAELLEKEACQGMEERKNLARKLGEEAGTKLLMPMFLMLILVMVILMVPAMISF